MSAEAAPAPAAGPATPAAVQVPAARPAPAPPVPASPAAPAAVPAPRCENCGAGVPGRYCSCCGQRLEPPIHTLWHFVRVATEDITHADSRLWRTLAALLAKPGFLTREFLQGHRARYLPPVRLYLVLSVAFFIWIAASRSEHVVAVGYSDRGVSRVDLTDAARPAPAAPAGAAAAGAAPRPDAAKARDTPAEERRLRCSRMNYQGPWRATIAPVLKRGCEQTVQDNGRALTASFLHDLPRAMFVFLPLMAGVMMLLYWRPRHYYVEHLLFLVHNHAFAFLLLMAAGALSALAPFAADLIGWATALYIAWYIYRATRLMYGQGRARTLGKLALMSFVYLVAGSLMLAITSLYAFLTL
jgi:hypothetical protein